MNKFTLQSTDNKYITRPYVTSQQCIEESISFILEESKIVRSVNNIEYHNNDLVTQEKSKIDGVFVFVFVFGYGFVKLCVFCAMLWSLKFACGCG